MSQDKPHYGEKKATLTAFISESRDREDNILYEAAICDKERNEIIRELTDYAREDLEREVLLQFSGIAIENG